MLTKLNRLNQGHPNNNNNNNKCMHVTTQAQLRRICMYN